MKCDYTYRWICVNWATQSWFQYSCMIRIGANFIGRQCKKCGISDERVAPVAMCWQQAATYIDSISSASQQAAATKSGRSLCHIVSSDMSNFRCHGRRYRLHAAVRRRAEPWDARDASALFCPTDIYIRARRPMFLPIETPLQSPTKWDKHIMRPEHEYKLRF